MKLDISKIVQARLDKDQFYAEESKKTQIYLHHTAGGGNAVAVSRYWNSNDTRIATAFVIVRLSLWVKVVLLQVVGSSI